MADVINLNRVRKARVRSEHDAQAAANRTKHGRTGAQKKADRLEGKQRATQLDGAKLENGATPVPSRKSSAGHTIAERDEELPAMPGGLNPDAPEKA